MGSSASKHRVLPGAARLESFAKPVTQNRISLQKHQPSATSTSTSTTTSTSSPAKNNVNASRIGQIRVEEVPLTLDPNHPALRTLRNRLELEKLLKTTTDSHAEANPSTVHPTTFVAIVEDLNHYSVQEVRDRYHLKEEFVTFLNAAKVQTARQKVEIVNDEDKQGKTAKRTREEQMKFELDRMNGVAGHKGDVGMERALEDLLKS